MPSTCARRGRHRITLNLSGQARDQDRWSPVSQSGRRLLRFTCKPMAFVYVESMTAARLVAARSHRRRYISLAEWSCVTKLNMSITVEINR